MLCMIWAIDEAISLSPLRALPSLSLSPCCLMFQFGGSKHSIRQINCLMHVISQTVYERGAPSAWRCLPPNCCYVLLTPLLLHARTVYSHIDRPIQAPPWMQRRLRTHIFTRTCSNIDVHMKCMMASAWACMDTHVYAPSYTQTTLYTCMRSLSLM